jgi:hypothetical protein
MKTLLLLTILAFAATANSYASIGRHDSPPRMPAQDNSTYEKNLKELEKDAARGVRYVNEKEMKKAAKMDKTEKTTLDRESHPKVLLP